MIGLKALMILDLMKLRNFFRDIIRKPTKLIVYLLQYLSILILIVVTFLQRGEAVGTLSNLKLSLLNAIITGLLLFVLLTSIYSSLKQPGIVFGEGDTAYILSSPISERIIFLWFIVRSSFKNIFIALLIGIYFPFLSTMMKIKISTNFLIYGYIGIFTFFLLLTPLSFLIYSISYRFNAKKIITNIIYIIIILTLLFALYYIKLENSITGLLTYLKLNIWDYIPILGPSKNLIISAFSGNSKYELLCTILQIITILFISFIALYFATDYYEEAIKMTEMVIKLRNKSRKGIYDPYDNKKYLGKKKRKVDLNLSLNGPWSFIWLKMIENIRSNGSLYFNYTNLIIIAISIIFGYFIPKNDKTLIFILPFIYVYMGYITSFTSAISVEINRMYIYVIPGSGLEKLIAVNIIPIYKSVITALLLIVPAAIEMKSGFANSITAILLIVSFTTMINFTIAFLNILLPGKGDLKGVMPLLRLFAILIFLIPVFAVAIPIGIFTNSIALGVLAASFMLFLISGVFLLFANFAFDYLELR